MPPPDLPPGVMPHSDSSDSMQVAASWGELEAWGAWRLKSPAVAGATAHLRGADAASSTPADAFPRAAPQAPSTVETSEPSGVQRSGLSGVYRVDYQVGQQLRLG